MRSLVRPALVFVALMTLLLGVLYPAAITGLAQLIFPSQANGSLIVENGKALGSRLIGQPFSAPGYLWPRPSATGPTPYNAAASSGSNLGPSNPALAEAVAGRIAALRAADSTLRSTVPVDLVTTSGSGLDPHLSPAAAAVQVPRIARARGMTPAAVEAVIAANTEGRFLGVFGEPRVSVLLVNLALDRDTP
ncbi:MAG TPA: potassium-transporting ATPase subunit KdpC [Gemmatimonadales bacterium]|nr:potassium-transporting ATPase subunit KdpC [Gemmatimonadales bacterium]